MANPKRDPWDFDEATLAVFAAAGVEVVYCNRERTGQPKRRQGRCGALCRTGEPCKMRVVKGKKRCRLHGGLSTGARTPEGRERISESNRRRAETRAANRAELLRHGEVALAEMEQRQREGLPLAEPGYLHMAANKR